MTDVGILLHDFMTELFPIFRSITGPGLRETLRRVGERIPLKTYEVPSEWTFRSAVIQTLSGETVVDAAANPLHIVHYSRPVDAVVPLAELRAHLHTLPDQPELIPYRTAYYSDGWGLCLSARDAVKLTEPAYRVTIDADLAPGSLSYGECLLPRETPDQMLISIHCCHPTLANDNLSGLLWVLNLADGHHNLFEMAERSGTPFHRIRAAAEVLVTAGLLAPASDLRDGGGALNRSRKFGAFHRKRPLRHANGTSPLLL